MVELKYYDLSRILSVGEGCQYFMCFGERSNGKTYQVLLHGLKDFINSGYQNQTAVIRRWHDDLVGKRAATVWDNLINNEKGENTVRKLTNGKYDNIIYRSGCWYLAKWDKENEKFISYPNPLAFGFTLSDSEHDKSSSYGKVQTILFDEFMPKNNNYSDNEFISFMNVCSTIIRGRDTVKIFMCANTLSKYCLYFDEMGLTNITKMKKGDIDIYKYGESGLKVAVEYCDSPNTKKPSDVYFAFDNPALKMITTGEWQLDIYPHLISKFDKKDVKFSYFIVFKENILQADIVIRQNEAFTFIHRKTTPLKAEDKDIIFTTECDQRNNYFGRLTKPVTKAGKRIYFFFANNKVFYASNDIGDIMSHYLAWSNGLVK